MGPSAKDTTRGTGTLFELLCPTVCLIQLIIFLFLFIDLNKMNCAYCVYHSRTCSENCYMRKLFPAGSSEYRKIVNHYSEFYVKELLKRILEQHKAAYVTSLVFDANARALDEVNGALGYIQRLFEGISKISAKYELIIQ